MSIQIDNAFVQQFSDNLIMLSQQRGAKLTNTVMRKDVTGKYTHFDRLGASTATKRTSRHADTPLSDTPHSRRRVVLEDYSTADLIDQQDELRMLIDPKSTYALSMSYTLGRSLDDIIIAAAQGSSTSVSSSDATSSIALPSTQIVDQSFATTDSDITLEKMIEAKRILVSNEVHPEDEAFFVLDSTALYTGLMREAEVQSTDYNTVKALVQGTINTFLGFTIIQSERLLDNSEGFKNCLAYAKSGIGLGMGKEPTVKVSERADKEHATQVYACMTAGASRIEEEKVVIVEAYRT